MIAVVGRQWLEGSLLDQSKDFGSDFVPSHFSNNFIHA